MGASGSAEWIISVGCGGVKSGVCGITSYAGDGFDQLARAADVADDCFAQVVTAARVGKAGFLGDERDGARRADAGGAQGLAGVAVEATGEIDGKDGRRLGVHPFDPARVAWWRRE